MPPLAAADLGSASEKLGRRAHASCLIGWRQRLLDRLSPISPYVWDFLADPLIPILLGLAGRDVAMEPEVDHFLEMVFTFGDGPTDRV